MDRSGPPPASDPRIQAIALHAHAKPRDFGALGAKEPLIGGCKVKSVVHPAHKVSKLELDNRPVSPYRFQILYHLLTPNSLFGPGPSPDKCKIMLCGHGIHKGLETVGYKWETTVTSCGQSTHKGLETLGEKWHLQETGDKLGDKCNIMQPQQPQCGRNASPETNVKSCGLVMHPFQVSKNPSQVNLFGEQTLWKLKGSKSKVVACLSC